MLSTRHFPPSQFWLIDRLQALDYPGNRGGMCHGVSMVNISNMLKNRFDYLMQLLYFVSCQDIPTLKEKVLAVWKKRRQLATVVRGNRWKNHWQRQEPYQFDLFLAQLDTMPDAKSIRISIQQEIDKSLTSEELFLLDIPPLFDQIELFQQPFLHADFFNSEAYPLTQVNTIKTIFDFLNTPDNSPAMSLNFFGVFSSVNRLAQHLYFFREFATKTALPIKCLLQNLSHGHAFAMEFLPDKKIWQIPDANTLALIHFHNDTSAAQAIANGFFAENKPILFWTYTWTQAHQGEALKKLAITEIANNNKWNKLLSFTPKKALLIDSGGGSLLHFAQEESLIQTLLKAGANPNQAILNSGETPLHLANSLPAVRILLKHGADIDAQKRIKKNFLLYFHQQPATVHNFLKKYYSDNIPVTIEGITALHIAAFENKLDIVRELISNHANYTFNEKGISPLSFAELGNHTEMVKLLKEYRDQLLPFVRCPIQLRFMLEEGANPNSITNTMTTALYEAVMLRAKCRVEILLTYQADPNFRPNGMTPLMAAVQFKDADILKLLLEHKANVNDAVIVKQQDYHLFPTLAELPHLPDKIILTALHLAILKKHTAAVRLLLKNGAVVDTKNILNPIDIATTLKCHQIVKLLTQRPSINSSPRFFSHPVKRKIDEANENNRRIKLA